MTFALFGARADNSGLGNQTWEFWRNMEPDATFGIDISSLTGKENYWSRYGAETDIALSRKQYVEIGANLVISEGMPDNGVIDYWLDELEAKGINLDAIFCAEIPYNYYLFTACKKRGIKTVLQYNYEFLDYLCEETLPLPDLFLAPSLWELEPAVKLLEEKLGSFVQYLPFPVNRKMLPNRVVSTCKKFIHVAGYELFEDRNGTQLVLEAAKHLEEDAHIIVYSQHDIPNFPKDNHKIELRLNNYANYWDLYLEGDALLLPRRYGGQSLQLNEALARGMVPIMLDVSPQENFLHPRCLVKPTSSKKIFTRIEIDCYDADPTHLAQRIDYLSAVDTTALSLLSNEMANTISWDTLKPEYLKALSQ